MRAQESKTPGVILNVLLKQQKTKVKNFVKPKRLKRTKIEDNQIEDDKFEYDSNIEMIQPIVKIVCAGECNCVKFRSITPL